MRKAILAGAAAMLALAGCENGAPEPQRKTVKLANPTSEGLKKLDELYRFLGLRRAIVDNGQRCKKVDAGRYQQDFKNMAMWTARCTDTGEWAIFIAPNGNVQVRRCGNLARINLPACQPLGTASETPAGGGEKRKAAAAGA
jgi:hypothetical protein